MADPAVLATAVRAGRAGHEVRDSVHCPCVGAMRAAAAKCLRVARHRLDIFAHLRRKAADTCA